MTAVPSAMKWSCPAFGALLGRKPLYHAHSLPLHSLQQSCLFKERPQIKMLQNQFLFISKLFLRAEQGKRITGKNNQGERQVLLPHPTLPLIFVL